MQRKVHKFNLHKTQTHDKLMNKSDDWQFRHETNMLNAHLRLRFVIVTTKKVAEKFKISRREI